MKRLLMTAMVLAGVGLAGTRWVAAETPSKPAPAHQHEHAAPPATKDAPAAKGGMGSMGGGKGMGMGMGMGMMAGGACPMMGTADTQITVKNTDKGVTITYTSSDPAKVVRLQKMAEAMRLMHEANTP
jgi:hypothetical protein